MRLLLASMLLVAAGCAAVPEPPSTTVTLVRHAETEDSGTRDPALSARGRARAARLGQRLAPHCPDAVLATPYRRTQETARLAAAACSDRPAEVTVVPIGEGGVAGYVADVAARVRALPVGSRVLVVGHSNTTPQAVNALAGTALADIDHGTYGRLFTVTVSEGNGALRESAY